MQKSNTPDRPWVQWRPDPSVEYQIADDFLRIRRWQDGQPKISAWLKWSKSTDETVRTHLRGMAWDALPEHRWSTANTPDPDQSNAFASWVRQHLPVALRAKQ